MKISEIRIGNWIKIHNRDHIFKIADFNFNELFLNPIPITEEWLLKFGFGYDIDTDCYHYYNFILNKLFVMMDIDMHICIEHVHQLQNLYFALTGEELDY